MRRSALLVSSLLALAISSTANAAGTVTGQLGIQLVITDGCTVGNGGSAGGTFGNIDFGSVAAITAPLEAQSVGSGGGGSFSVTCNNGTDYSVTLDSGGNPAGGQRNMSNGTDLIAYNLFQDAGRTTPWGDGSNGGDTLDSTGNGEVQEIVVYGQVPPRAAVPSVGTYTDTVQVTVAW
ncbi:spore coat U domain-containing protein [Pseudomonas sp. MM211]|uniref:Csu type fimbrial protein n=1 Tax=Pseudomonas sp. MM211 TaxID=2866808 RepID=UPI001CEDF301|nr:spore coat U domain-containing protein [Pseudomonas sp. MM211]UCJ18527.1 spore coat U domain-containing protein [Pseudomonas sp. MM211]